MKDPRYAADREQRRLDGATTNPNATPVGKGRQQAAQEMQAAQTGGQPPAAPSITPRIDSNPARNNAVAVATANRNGAFGTGAQNLQGRRDLYQQMAADPGAIDNPAYKARAQALGVTEKGWANAGNKLGAWGTGAAAPAAPAVAAAPTSGAAKAQSDIATLGQAGAVAAYQQRNPVTPVTPRQPAQNALAANAPLPNPSPAAPLPGQAKAGAISPLPQGQATTPISTPWTGAATTWNNSASFQAPAPPPITAQPVASQNGSIPAITNQAPTPTAPLPDKVANGGISTPPPAGQPTAKTNDEIIAEGAARMAAIQQESTPGTQTASLGGAVQDVGIGMSQSDAAAVSVGADSRNVGIINAPGMYSNAVNAVAKPATNAVYNTAAKTFVGASRLTGEATAAENLAKIADAAKNTSKTGSAARETWRGVAATQEALAAQKLGTAASLARTGNVIEGVGNAVAKTGKFASLGKVGAAAGKWAPWAQAAQIGYESAMLATDGNRREQRVNELEKATTGDGKSLGAGMARGALEGVLNPAATIYATGAHIGKALQSNKDANASVAALRGAEERFQKRKDARDKYGDRWKSMTHAQKKEIYASSGAA